MKYGVKFTARSKTDAQHRFALCVTGTISWKKGDSPTKKEIIQDIKERMAEEWTKGPFVYTPDMITVKLGA